jgi:3,4-dihydroxy 2-butanone 4-phosphate synthase/GTP cyclohydrolase II
MTPTKSSAPHPTEAALATIEEIITEAKQGKMFILVDDESRENEGDLVLPAEKTTPEAINFMIKYARGLVCLTLTEERVKELHLPQMSYANRSKFQTAFTVSIEAQEGVTTGISAADRAHTIQVAIDPTRNAHDITSPGHIFPIAAKDGGVMVRAGHTEASVDIARMAGFNPSGVICEIMNDDGTMARMPDLKKFAAQHGLKIATIKDLIAYRRRHENLVSRQIEAHFHSQFAGNFHMIVYATSHHRAEHIALVKGDIHAKEPTLVRMHAINILADTLGDTFHGKDGELQRAMKMIDAHGSGVIVLLRDEHPSSISDQMVKRLDKPETSHHNLRDYGIGAQILLDLGIKNMQLLTNSKPMAVALEGYGLTIAGYTPIDSSL